MTYLIQFQSTLYFKKAPFVYLIILAGSSPSFGSISRARIKSFELVHNDLMNLPPLKGSNHTDSSPEQLRLRVRYPDLRLRQWSGHLPENAESPRSDPPGVGEDVVQAQRQVRSAIIVFFI